MKTRTIGLLVAGVATVAVGGTYALDQVYGSSEASQFSTSNPLDKMPPPYTPSETPKTVAVPTTQVSVTQGVPIKVIAGPADIVCPTEDSCVTPDYRNGAWWTRTINNDGTFGPWMRLTR